VYCFTVVLGTCILKKEWGGEERGMEKGGKTCGWWVLRNQQWSGVPTLVKGVNGRVVWY